MLNCKKIVIKKKTITGEVYVFKISRGPLTDRNLTSTFIRDSSFQFKMVSRFLTERYFEGYYSYFRQLLS